MFEEVEREISRLGRARDVQIPVKSDEEGYLDRECPFQECRKQFKIHEDGWESKVSKERVYCRFCRHCKGADHWWTTEQSKRAKEKAVAHRIAQTQRAMHVGLKRDIRKWNRRQSRNSPLQLKMSVRGPVPTVPLPSPISANDPLRFKVVCSNCSCRYAVVGCAFFCPACGYNDAGMMFGQALKGIRTSLDSLDSIEQTDLDADTKENRRREVVEGGLQNAVAAFQSYAEALYEGLSNVAKARRNAFQNLDEGNKMWFKVTSRRYSDYLTEDELRNLKFAFQRRHLLAHRQGLVDQTYIDRSADNTYLPGQRLSLRRESVRMYVDIIEKLASGMRKSVSGLSRQSHH